MEDSKIDILEKRLQTLEASIGSTTRVKREKKKPSAYNLFIKDEFSKLKSSLPEGSKINNQDAIKDIAKKWKTLNSPVEINEQIKSVKIVKSKGVKKVDDKKVIK